MPAAAAEQANIVALNTALIHCKPAVAAQSAPSSITTAAPLGGSSSTAASAIGKTTESITPRPTRILVTLSAATFMIARTISVIQSTLIHASGAITAAPAAATKPT